MKRWFWLAAAAALPALGGEAESGGPEPEQIDVLYGRLVEMGKTLDAAAEIMERLDQVAAQPEAAYELLSVEGDPTDRLRRALNSVASRRQARRAEERVAQAAATQVVVQPQENREELWVDVVYAELGREGGGRVVIEALGRHFAAGVGQTVRVGADVVEVLAVEPGEGGGIGVELRVNGGARVYRRAGS